MSDYSYWQIFTDADIPIWSRIGWASVFPIAAPLTAITSLQGCVLQPDRPVPLDESLPLPPSTIVPLTTPDAQSPRDTFTCVPESCSPGRLDSTRVSGNTTLCLSFAQLQKQFGFTSTAQHTNVTLVDINHDGWMDLYLVNHDAPNALFINQSGKGFVESSAAYALDIGGDTRAAIFFDDNSNNNLMLVSASGSRLYRREGDLFAPLDASHGIVDKNPARTAAWIGADLLLATENGTKFYQRQSDGRFVENAAAVGVWDPGDGAAIAIADYDGDSLTDIFLANITGVNRLFRNRGDGTYAAADAIAPPAILGQVQNMDASWVSIQGEISPSLSIASWDAMSPLYINQQDGTFFENATALRVRAPGNTMRIAWGDMLGEQRPAAFFARWEQENLLYLPLLDPHTHAVREYLDIAYPLGMSQIEQTLAAAWFDYDHDAQLDLVVVATHALHLYHNESRYVRTCPAGGSL